MKKIVTILFLSCFTFSSSPCLADCSKEKARQILSQYSYLHDATEFHSFSGDKSQLLLDVDNALACLSIQLKSPDTSYNDLMLFAKSYWLSGLLGNKESLEKSLNYAQYAGEYFPSEIGPYLFLAEHFEQLEIFNAATDFYFLAHWRTTETNRATVLKKLALSFFSLGAVSWAEQTGRAALALNPELHELQAFMAEAKKKKQAGITITYTPEIIHYKNGQLGFSLDIHKGWSVAPNKILERSQDVDGLTCVIPHGSPASFSATTEPGAVVFHAERMETAEAAKREAFSYLYNMDKKSELVAHGENWGIFLENKDGKESQYFLEVETYDNVAYFIMYYAAPEVFAEEIKTIRDWADSIRMGEFE